MLTQATIAEKVGVSRRAVGFALSDNPRAQKQVAAKTRQRVLDTAERLGYRPHRHAQLMRGKKSAVIGVIKTTGIVQTGVERSFFASHAIQAAGYGLVVNEIHWDEAGVRRATDAMLDAHVEGVVLSGLGSLDEAAEVELQRLRAARTPMVTIGGVRPAAIPFVTTDYRQGMAALTKHVLELGYRKLALVLPVIPEEAHLPQHWGFGERLAGFREAIAAAGLSPAQARTLYQPFSSDWTDDYTPGREVIRQLVANGNRPEALLCSNDSMVIGAIAECAEAGWRVPDDIAITGFDNTTVGRHIVPALTSVAQPTEAVAKKAVELLLKQMRGETISTDEELVKLPCQLVVRESCGNNQKQGRSL